MSPEPSLPAPGQLCRSNLQTPPPPLTAPEGPLRAFFFPLLPSEEGGLFPAPVPGALGGHAGRSPSGLGFSIRMHLGFREPPQSLLFSDSVPEKSATVPRVQLCFGGGWFRRLQTSVTYSKKCGAMSESVARTHPSLSGARAARSHPQVWT